MKKVLIFLVFGFILNACEGPAGPQGPVGPVGPQGTPGATGATGTSGKDGTNGTNGKDGTSATARYYDFELNYSGSTPGSSDDYKIPGWDFNKYYALTYVYNSGLVHPLGVVVAEDLLSKTSNIVDMDITYTTGTTGLIFISDFRYKDNGPSRYKFRTVVIPMVSGGRLNASTPYDVLKKKYNLPD